MNEISIAVRYNNDLRTVSGRELHKVLQIKTHYALWFDRMRDYGFRENTDFFTVFKNVFREDGRAMPQKQIDHNLTIDMAKQLCMIQRTEIGKRCREYFLNLEKQWNSPDAVMARALQIADQKLELANQQNNNLIETTAVQATLFVFFFFFLRDRRSVMQKKSVRQMFRKYPDVVTIPQVCEMLGVSRNYAYLLVKQGKLTRLDLGRIIRVTKSSVIELKEKSLQKSENSPV